MRAAVRKLALAGTLVVAAVCIAAAQSMAQEPAAPPAAPATGSGAVKGVQAGFLTCNVSSGWGFILGSSRDLKCVWEPQKGVEYHYTGTVGQFGADIGYHHSSVIIWAVATATNDFGAGGLAGTYAGATAQAAAGAGGGVSVLVGGFNHSVTLQPISISGEIGLNAAAGIQAITLKKAK